WGIAFSITGPSGALRRTRRQTDVSSVEATRTRSTQRLEGGKEHGPRCDGG
ncbi:unnamed protein product, partial [Ectocarpus sp. 12 AP-2014]